MKSHIRIWMVMLFLAVGQIACDRQKSMVNKNLKEAVNRIKKTKNLDLDSLGRLRLESDVAAHVKGGMAYVLKNDKSGQWILFPDWMGKGSNVSGFLFVDPPFGSTGPRVGEMLTPVSLPDPKYGIMRSEHLNIRASYDDHWYYVDFRLD